MLPAAKKGSSGLNLLREAIQKGKPNPRSSGAVTVASIASMAHNTSDLGLLTRMF